MPESAENHETKASEKSARPSPAVPVSDSLTRRVVLVSLGCVFVVLAGLGVFLPVLPTTPFLLLASACFIRSSPRLNAWLLRSRVFGPFLRDWQQHHGVRLHVKITAVTVLALAVAASFVFGNLGWHWQLLLVGLALIGLIVILRLRTIRPLEAAAAPASAAGGSPAQTYAQPTAPKDGGTTAEADSS